MRRRKICAAFYVCYFFIIALCKSARKNVLRGGQPRFVLKFSAAYGEVVFKDFYKEALASAVMLAVACTLPQIAYRCGVEVVCVLAVSE